MPKRVVSLLSCFILILLGGCKAELIETKIKTSDIRKNAKRVFLSILNHRIFAAFKKRIALGQPNNDKVDSHK